MKTKLHVLLIDLIEAWDTYYYHESNSNKDNMDSAVTEIKRELRFLDYVSRRVQKSRDEVENNSNMIHAELNRKATNITVPLTPFEGHPPGNDFEDEQTIALMNGDDLTDYRGDK